MGPMEAGGTCFWSLDSGASLGPRVAGRGFGPAEADTTKWPTGVGASLELRWAGVVFCSPGVDIGARMGRGDARARLGPFEEDGIAAGGPTGVRANLGSEHTGAAFSFAES